MAFDFKSSYYLYKKYYFEFEKLYKSKKEVRAYVGLSAAILTLSFFVVFAIKPTLTTIAALRADIRSQEEVNARLDEKVNAIRQARTNFDQASSRLYLIDDAGPTLPWAVRFMRQMEAAASERGVALNSVGFEVITVSPGSPGQEAPPAEALASYRLANFTLSASGAFEQLDSFVDQLEGLRRIVEVDGYSYLAAESPDVLTVNIRGGVIYLPN